MGGSMSNPEKEFRPVFSVNYPTENVSVNIATNIRRALPQAQPHHVQTTPIGIVAGGPSLVHFEDEIKQRHADGMKFVSVNGTHDWLLDRGITPSVHVMVDSRPHNLRFVRNPNKRTKYFLASQCHPKVFDALEDHEVYIWHAYMCPSDRAVLDEHYLGKYFMTPGGSTVVLRAISVLRMLGFVRQEIWGFDSCMMNGKHHAYEMPENNGEPHATAVVGDREFVCESWMFSQAEEFQNLVKFYKDDDLSLVVHGDGLIAHIINTGKALQEKEDG
jgi:hypothetical protein